MNPSPFHIAIDDVRARLEGVRGRRDKFSAKCPAHADRNNSLSVSVGRDERVLFKCFAGCAYERIIAALGFNRPTLRPADIRFAQRAQERELIPAKVEESNRAADQHRDGVYVTLIRNLLTLKPKHRDDLLRRGLTFAEIRRNGYVSTPTREEGKRITGELAGDFDLSGVPGFYCENDQWCMVHLGEGFFVPIRDERLRASLKSLKPAF